ncbi:MAG: DUF6427 family protein [Bacteroidota bacterium]|nr:DUF6427 family protein [Bacteroidota bacterium]
MIIRLFKSNHYILIVALAIIAILMKYYATAVSSCMNNIIIMPGFSFFNVLIGNSGMVSGIAVISLILIESLLLNSLVYNAQLIKKDTYVPALIYIVLMCSTNEMMVFNPVLFSNLFLIIALKGIFRIYDESLTDKYIFETSFIVAVSSLFYFPSLIFILLIYISFVVYSLYSLRRWMIALIGLITPYLYVFTYYYLFNKLNPFIVGRILPNFRLEVSKIHFNFSWGAFSVILISIIILGYSFFRYLGKMNEGVIKVRKFKVVIVWFLLLSLFWFLFAKNHIMQFSMVVIPSVVFISDLFLSIKKNWFAETLFLLVILTIVYLRVYF